MSVYTTSRDNNFKLIRFIAASLVLFSHSFALSLGPGAPEPLSSTIGMTWGTIAVDIFFVTSGFLVTNSYFSRDNLVAFVWARVLRIYPALIVAIIFCVFIVGAWFTTNSTIEYLLNPQVHKYFAKNTTLFLGLEDRLPGVFLNVPYKGAINGSLWSLPCEIKMYAILAFTLCCVAYVTKRIKFITVRNVILLVGISSICLNIFNHFHNYFQAILSVKFVHLFSMFFVGVALFVWRDKVYLSSKLIFFGLPMLILSAINKDVFFIIYCLLWPSLILCLAYVPAGYIRKFNGYGDYSYGIYIYAFPVQQSAVSLIPNIAILTMIMVSFGVTLLLSMLSWHLIERRFIELKGSYVVIENFLQNNGLTRRFNRINRTL